MLMVTNRGRNKILRDVDRTRLEVKNKTCPNCIFLCISFESLLRIVPVKAKMRKDQPR